MMNYHLLYHYINLIFLIIGQLVNFLLEFFKIIKFQLFVQVALFNLGKNILLIYSVDLLFHGILNVCFNFNPFY